MHLADRTSEALEQSRRRKHWPKDLKQRYRCAELHRLRGVFLATLGADETKIEASFCEAIRIAKEQKSISLAKRAEATYAEYRQAKSERVRRTWIPTTSLTFLQLYEFSFNAPPAKSVAVLRRVALAGTMQMQGRSWRAFLTFKNRHYAKYRAKNCAK